MTKEVMKMALEALAEDRAWLESDAPKEVWDKNNKAIAAIKEALAQTEQEPVQTIPSFTQLQQIIKNLEHCLSRDSKQEFLRVWIRDWTEHKLSQNTTPPQRTWVGLTDDEMYKLWLTVDEETDRMAFGKAVEAKLKEKNT
jgi:hypothetical protein